jgi:aminoglycoside/choline kinase family phosphotransferase
MNPHDFLRAEGFGGATLHPLPADASFRRYTRLIGGPRPALLMEAPPPEDTRPFIRIAQHLLAAGLSAPEIIAANKTAGLLIIEDFGPQTLAQQLDAGADPVPLYAEAAEALARLHSVAPPPGLPGWDAAAMAKATAATFLDWWWPASFGTPATDAVREELATALHDMLAPFAAQGFVHRDYFPANLMRLPGRDGARRVGILDFQDAALGHPAYDLVSLVEDARRDVAPEARRAAVAAYLRHRPGTSPNELLAGLAAHGAQRHLRVAALWVRLARRDAKPGYLIHGPRCWRLLARSLSHPVCGPLVEFLDKHVPDDRRGNPPSSPEAT